MVEGLAENTLLRFERANVLGNGVFQKTIVKEQLGIVFLIRAIDQFQIQKSALAQQFR